jgi:ribosomal protein RSM22 (predicted rRNA methylase)
MLAKNAVVPFEDERFSYVIALRQEVETTGSRILAPPDVTKPGIKLKLCTASGVQSPMIARRDGANYKRVRKCEWGDMF